MDCRRAQSYISERMDGEHLSQRVAAAVDGHVAGCSECAAFAEGASRLRAAARLRVAAAVPDLIEPIMAAVEAEAARRPARPRLAAPVLGPRRPRWNGLARRLAPAVAALVVGVVAGSESVGGPWQRAQTTTVAAADVTRGVAAAAARLGAYQARFQITEWHFDPQVPVREFGMNVWFQAPERFRMDVTDHTEYPSATWGPNDLSLVANGSSWYLAGPAPCPSAPGTCPPTRTVVRHRVPFSASAPVPTDLVLPITTLADANQLRVVGRGTVLGRSAVEVELPFARATPLFPFLTLGGSWRPFFPEDRVVLWLDARSFLPLRYRVYPARGPERRAWALRFGLPEEPPGRAIFDVSALSVSNQPPPSGTFAIPSRGPSRDQGARAVSLKAAARTIGYRPVTPASVDGLAPYRVVLPPPGATNASEATVIAYARGLSWLKLGETRDWTGDSFYGPVGLQAAQVTLANGGLAYYEPATDRHGRRLAIHAAGTDLYLETNLSRGSLLQVAASLPVRGEAMPQAWRVRRSPDGLTERVAIAGAIRSVPFAVQMPTRLPPGYGLASAELVRLGPNTGLNVYFQQADTDLGGGAIRLHLEAGTGLPPASAAIQSLVPVRGREGRWTPDRHQLEWVEDGVYYSLDAPGLALVDLLAVAESLAPAASAGATPAAASPSGRVSP